MRKKTEQGHRGERKKVFSEVELATLGKQIVEYLETLSAAERKQIRKGFQELAKGKLDTFFQYTWPLLVYIVVSLIPDPIPVVDEALTLPFAVLYNLYFVFKTLPRKERELIAKHVVLALANKATRNSKVTHLVATAKAHAENNQQSAVKK